MPIQQVQGKKILYLITKSNWGGAQKYVFDLATNLASRTPSSNTSPLEEVWEPVVALGSPESDSTGGGKGLLAEKLQQAGVRTITIPHLGRDMNLWKDFLVLISLFQIIWREKPGVIHVNSSKLAGLGAFVGRVLFVNKVIFTAHGWPFHEERAWWQKRVIYLFSWLTSFFAHKTIVITKLDYECGKKFFLLGHKMVYIPLGIREPNFLPREKAREELQNMAQQRGISLPVDKLWIGTIGELHPNKGYDLLLLALANLSAVKPPTVGGLTADRWHYIAIGEGEERDKIEEQIKKLGLKDRVTLLGFVPDATKYLKAFDIFTLTSRKEGLPYTLLEAGFAGIPIYATSVGGIPDIVTTRETLEKLISDKSRRNEVGSQIHNHVTTKFSFEKMLRATNSLYQEIRE